LPLGLIPGVNATWIVIVVVLAIVSEMTGVIVVQIGAQRGYDGPMGKSDRAFVLGLLCLLLGWGFIPAIWFDYAMIVIVVLLVVTIFKRSWRALAEAA
jgi:CDP-diacylglycerol--glycerol-3-phosphate 3-phosphatidyltransferase